MTHPHDGVKITSIRQIPVSEREVNSTHTIPHNSTIAPEPVKDSFNEDDFDIDLYIEQELGRSTFPVEPSLIIVLIAIVCVVVLFNYVFVRLFGVDVGASQLVPLTTVEDTVSSIP